jgi:hypothetical protein
MSASTGEIVVTLATSANAALFVGAAVRFFWRIRTGKRVREREFIRDLLTRCETAETARDAYRLQLGWAHYELLRHGLAIPTADPALVPTVTTLNPPKKKSAKKSTSKEK